MSFQESPDGDYELPDGFQTIKQIQDASNEEIKKGKKVDVIGFVKDYQKPTRTQGSDWKCTIEIKDHSIKYEAFGIKLSVFWKNEEDMPQVTGSGDIVLIRSAKIQFRNGSVALLANFTTKIHILTASKIPNTVSAAKTAQWRSYPRKAKSPEFIETAYAIRANKRVDELELPSHMEFFEKVTATGTVKNKFSLLKDVQPEKFYDIIGEIVDVHDYGDERARLYISDYTANSHFYEYKKNDESSNNGRDGDRYGYIKAQKQSKDWPGPYGKMSIQLTLFDGNAEYARHHLKPGDWAKFSNVKINYGKTGANLEGFHHGERGRETEYRIQILEKTNEPTEDDKRCIEAIERKYNYEKKQAKKQKSLEDEATNSSGNLKRKLEGESGKERRKRLRNENRAAIEAGLVAKSDLNPLIRCAFPEQSIVRLSEILKPKTIKHLETRTTHFSPFTNNKYRVNVRIIDYFPPRVEDFAIGRRESIYNRLPDFSGGEETDREEDLKIFKNGGGFSKKIWQWRFALLVEDAMGDSRWGNGEKDKVWLIVDNLAAQGLLNIEENATSLRDDNELLARVKEQLFKLWGDLEERKSAALPPQSSLEPTSSFDEDMPRVGAQPDLDSDVEMEIGSLDEGKRQPPESLLNAGGCAKTKEEGLKLRNKAFTCCVKQYGIKIREVDSGKMDAGKGWRWQRMFGLFGTHIS